MEAKYDVIIAGAGPAGLSCAAGLKESGLSVLLIDKNKRIGAKACAGGITQMACEYELPDGLYRSFSRQKVYINGFAFKFRLMNSLKTISRTDLAIHQLKCIEESKHVELCHPCRLISIGHEKIITDRGEFGFRYLVGADGSASKVRKFLGLKSSFCAALYVEIPEITNDFIWHVYPGKLGSAYIWTFPHPNHTNTGIYFNPAFIKTKTAREFLRQHLNEVGKNLPDHSFKGGFVNHLYRGCIFGNIFLAGDAAGLAIKTSGEGIGPALISGSEIAHRIIHPQYRMPKLNRLVKIKQRQEKMLAIYQRHPRWHQLMYVFFLLAMKCKNFQRWFGN